MHQEPSQKVLLWLVAVGFFMQTLDATIVNTALPAMARSLGESPLRMQSVIVAYSLTMAMLSWLVRHLVSLSAGVLLGTALLHTLPEAFESGVDSHRLFATLLGGRLFFFLLEKAELYRHEHHHVDDERHHDQQQSERKHQSAQPLAGGIAEGGIGLDDDETERAQADEGAREHA